MAVPPPAPADRKALRRTLRDARRCFVEGLDARGYDAASAAIDARLWPLLKRAGPIAAYVAQPGEPDVLPFLTAAWDAGHEVALPHIAPGDAPGRMTFARWSPSAPLAPGALDIPQPASVEAIEPAIVLTPLVGFDRAGWRLGQGGGYYDRWFAEHPAAMRVGIAWSVQEVPALDAAAWDMPLHAVVTEQEWIAPA